MLRKVVAHLRAQWMGALALLIAIGTGSAYAANTIGSTDIINGQVKSPDIGNNQVQSIDVKDEGLTGADIADQSGVDTCAQGVRRGDLCVVGESTERIWFQALQRCDSLELRLPSFAEAATLARNYDLPGVASGENFWTDHSIDIGDAIYFTEGSEGLHHSATGIAFPTVCVTTPTN
jgi:hypothetical protein